MALPQTAALIAALLLACVAVFQAALALGAPLGGYAWGGRHPGVLPARLRRGSAISAVVLIALAAIALIRGGLIYPEWQRQMVIAVWVIVLFMVINTLGNSRSKSVGERRVMTPLTALIGALLIYVQVSAA